MSDIGLPDWMVGTDDPVDTAGNPVEQGLTLIREARAEGHNAQKFAHGERLILAALNSAATYGEALAIRDAAGYLRVIYGPGGGWSQVLERFATHPDVLGQLSRERARSAGVPPSIDWGMEWDMAPESTDWLAEPLIPARRSVSIFSPAKAGKSMLLLEAAACLSMGGRRFLGAEIPRPVSVLYVDAENSVRDDVIPRLKAMGFGPSDLSRLHYLSFPDLASLDSHKGGRELMKAVDFYDAELVIVDTMSRTIAGEENSNDTAIAWHRHTGARLKAAGVALVRLDHSGHDKAGHARGASAKAGDVDATWSIEKVTDDRIRVKLVEARFVIAESDLLIERVADPELHHKVVAGHVPAEVAATMEGQRVAALDASDLDAATATVKAARQCLRDAGLGAKNEHLDRAIRAWRTSHGHWSDVEPDTSE